MDKEELIGQIIDIFEDELTGRNMSIYNTNPRPKTAVIPLHFEDEDSDGVFFGGNHYDKVAVKIEETLRNWGLLKEPKCLPELYVIKDENLWCVSTSEEECYCDEEIWLALGISEEKFYEIARKYSPTFKHHFFDYGSNDEKKVCDTSFSTEVFAQLFKTALIEEASK